MFIEEDHKAIYGLLQKAGLDKLAHRIFWYQRFPLTNKSEMIRLFPEDYDILNCPLREVPFHINHAELSVRLIAAYRLKVRR